MATKYGDFSVSAVRYSAGNGHIVAVKVHVYDAAKNQMLEKGEMTRDEVVKHIHAGKTFVTILVQDGKWIAGAPLQIISLVTDYLKTKADKTTKDNLEALPTY